jgi:thymidylate synthase
VYIDGSTPEVYPEIVDVLRAEADQGSRVGETRERLCITVHSSDPRTRMLYRPNFNLAFALQERAAYWFGKNPGHVERYNSKMEEFMYDDELHGSAYGRYFRHLPHDQINRVLTMLDDDPDTRRAVINVHNAYVEDYDGPDVACTIYLQPFIRGGNLHLVANLRSQDMLWGYPYDTQAFQWIQEMMAAELDVDLGHYWHIMNSCHFYTEMEGEIIETANNYEFDRADYDFNDSSVNGEMEKLESRLEEARNGGVPAFDLSQPYHDWLAAITSYEQRRFHDDPETAAALADRIERPAWRRWV